MLPTVLLFSLPWLVLVTYVLVMVREPPDLPPAGPERDGGTRPLVSVIVPARNEAHNIGTCVRSLVAADYPAYEVIVVDDRSEDGTGDLAREAALGAAARVVVLNGEPVPSDWFGKQWACAQGARAARGELLLFTDADTVHGPTLLRDVVGEMERSGADCVTVIGRQIMESFWVRLVQPQVFTLLGIRYPRMGAVPTPQKRWRSAIANGQYLMFRRAAYEALGGHESVRYEAAEDLRLAQRLVRTGGMLVMRGTRAGLGTRMYRDLGEVVAGWSKNMIPAGLQTLHPALRGVAPVGMLLSGVALWLAPPAALLAALAGAGGPLLLAWSAAVTALLMGFWTILGLRFGAPAWVGPLYPLGAVVGHWILLRSWLGRRNVQWKGRSYAWDVYSDVQADDEDDALRPPPPAGRAP